MHRLGDEEAERGPEAVAREREHERTESEREGEGEWQASALALSSGGVKGMGMLGALIVLEREGFLAGVQTYIGASVGAVISLMMLVGCTLHEIFELSLRSAVLVPWKEMHKVDTALFVEFGFSPHEKVTAEIADMIRSKCDGRVPTMRELFERTGKRLIMVNGNLDDHCVEYIDHISHPELPCLSAMTASMLVPGAVSRCIIDGKLHVDGAFVDPYPASHLDDGTERILGIAVVGTELDPHSSFMSYMYSAASLAFDRLQELSMRGASRNVRTIELRLPDISIVDRGKDMNKRLRCFNAGTLQCMHAVARLRGSTYEQYYGISVLPTEYTEVPTHEVKKHLLHAGEPRQPTRRGRMQLLGDRLSAALGRIPVPHVQPQH
jgi:predicted acylesterase/phospholipase RssA